MKHVANLGAVAVDRDRFSPFGLPDEAGDDHAVAAALPGADRIEQPCDYDLQAADLMVRQCEIFADGLGTRIGPAGLRRRSQHDVRVFALGQHRGLAVDLRRRRDQDRLAVTRAGGEYRRRAASVVGQQAGGLIREQAHADARREVEHPIAVRDQGVDPLFVADRVDGHGQ